MVRHENILLQADAYRPHRDILLLGRVPCPHRNQGDRRAFVASFSSVTKLAGLSAKGRKGKRGYCCSYSGPDSKGRCKMKLLSLLLLCGIACGQTQCKTFLDAKGRCVIGGGGGSNGGGSSGGGYSVMENGKEVHIPYADDSFPPPPATKKPEPRDVPAIPINPCPPSMERCAVVGPLHWTLYKRQPHSLRERKRKSIIGATCLRPER